MRPDTLIVENQGVLDAECWSMVLTHGFKRIYYQDGQTTEVATVLRLFNRLASGQLKITSAWDNIGDYPNPDD